MLTDRRQQLVQSVNIAATKMMWKIFLLVNVVALSRNNEIFSVPDQNYFLGSCYIDPGLELMKCVDDGGDLNDCAAQYVLSAQRRKYFIIYLQVYGSL